MKLHSLGALTAGTWLLVNVAAYAAGPDPLPGWRDGKTKQAILKFVGRDHPWRQPALRAGARAHRGVRQRRHALVRTADVRAVGLCARSHQGARPAAPGVADPGALQVRACRGPQGGARRRRQGDRRDGDGDPLRHDQRGVRGHRTTVAGDGEESRRPDACTAR